MPPPPNLGLGPNDPNGNRRTAGTPFNASGASSNLGGLSFGKSDVDTSGLADVSAKFKQITADVTKLDTVLQKLVSTASKLSSVMGIRSGGSSSGGGGGGSLTTAVFSGGGGANRAGGTAGTVTAAAFGSGGQGTSGNRNTPAPVSAFGGGQQGAGRTLGLMAMGEIGSQWAGSINSAMSSIQGGAGAIDVMGRQAATMFGGSTASNVSSYGFSSQSLMDRGQALAAITANPMLAGAMQGGSQQNKALFGKSGFVNTLQGLSPGMSAAGAAGLASQLTSGTVLQALQRYGARNGQPGQGLVNPQTMQLNSSSRVFSELLQTLMGGRQLNQSQMKALGSNTAQSSRDWTMMTANAQNLGIPSQLLPLLRQYAATGGNLSAAEKNMSNSPVAAQLGLATSKTNLKTTAYEKTTGEQTTQAHAMTDFYNILNKMTQNGGPLPNLLAGFGQLSSGVLGAAGKIAEFTVLMKGVSSLFGGGGAAAGGGLLARLGLGGGGGTATAGGALGTGPAAGAATTVGGTAAAGGIAEGTTTAAEVAGGVGLGTSLAFAGALAAPVIAATLLPDDRSKALPNANQKAQLIALAKAGGGTGAGVLRYLQNQNKTLSPQAQYTQNAMTNEVSLLKTSGLLQMGDPPTGNTTTAGMKPGLASRVSAMMAANPNVKITSGYRSPAQQAYLYSAKGGQGVAKVGQSAHQTGNAADLGPPSQFGWIAKNASKYGLARPAPQSEPWHVQTMGDPATSATGSQAVSVAQGQLGVPYSWGAEAAGQGFDCSGLVQYVFGKIGISLPRTTYQQVKSGTAVNGIGSAQPGDLLFYAGSDGTASNPGHVAIYIGGGKQIEAPYTGTVVQIDSVGSAGAVVAIRRVVKGGAGTAAVQAAQATVGAPSNDTHGAGGVATSAMNTFISQVGANNNWDLTPGAGGATAGGGSGSGSTTSSAATSSGGSAGAASSTTGAAAPTAGSMSAQQVYQLALGAGLSKSAARTATAVAKVESSFNPQAVDHDSNGTTDYGLWQINSINGGSQALFNAAAAAAKMASMTNKGNSWGDWGPDFGEAGYGTNPPGGGLPGSKVATAMAQLGTLGDPVGPSGSAPMSSMASGTGAVASVSMGGMSGGRGVSIYMPVQVVGVSSQDAQNLAQMVLALLKQADSLSSVSEN